MMKSTILQLLAITYSVMVFGQGAMMNRLFVDDVPHYLERLEVTLGKQPPFHNNIKSYQLGAITQFGVTIAQDTGILLSKVDQFNLEGIFLDNNEWLYQRPYARTLAERKPQQDSLGHALLSQRSSLYRTSKKPLLKAFYKTPAYIFEINQPYFHLRVFPLANIQYGSVADNEDPYFLGRRGFGFRGGIDDRIYFSFHLLETQANFPGYMDEYIRKFQTVPGEGLVKNYASDPLGFDRGFDFLNGHGYLGFNFSKHGGVQWGYGRNFIGNGERSLFLSDFSNNYYFLKLNWQLWRFHYQNIFAELSAASKFPGVKSDRLLQKKYMAAHYLSFQATPSFNIGIFEAVVFNRENHFELHYLNPIIFYRTIEGALGSPDNVLLGGDLKWNIKRSIQLYGQIIFDEIKIDELTSGEGWWGNKFGLQAGLKYFDAFNIPQLDLQVEYNQVRPYTYSHTDSLNSFTHYQQPLAHPLGANFKEWIFLARYQPLPKWVFEARLFSMLTSDDADGMNWGSNLLRSNRLRVQDYGNEIGQGGEGTTLLFSLEASYQIAHRIYLDAYYQSRSRDSDLMTANESTTFFGGGIRMFLRKRRFDF